MTPQEAIQIIDQVLASINGTRADHQKLQEAIAVLREVVNKKPEDESKSQD